MKRNLIGILSLVAISLMLNATGAYAQSYAKANVPFDFKLGSAQLPAGTYELRLFAQNGWQRLALSNTVTVGPTLAVTPLTTDIAGHTDFLGPIDHAQNVARHHRARRSCLPIPRTPAFHRTVSARR